MRPLKWLTLALLASCLGCASLRSWGDQDLVAGPSPVVGMSVGAAANAVSIKLNRPWYEQLAMTAGIAYAGRFTKLIGGHKNAEWHLEVAFGAGLSHWLNMMLCKRNPAGECTRH